MAATSSVRSPTGSAVPDDELTRALWDLVWAGRLGNDTLAPVRGCWARDARRIARVRSPRRADATDAPSPARRCRAEPVPPRQPDAGPRFPSSTPTRPPAPPRAELLLDRHGVVTRGSVAAEDQPGGFAAIYRVLAAARNPDGCAAATLRRGPRGRAVRRGRRGRPAAGDGPSTGRHPERTRPGARRCRSGEPLRRRARVAVASRHRRPRPPARTQGRRPGGAGRRAPRAVRGAWGRTLLSWTDDPALLEPAAVGLAGAVHAGALGKLTVERVDGESVLGSNQPLGPGPRPRPGSA